MAFDRVQYYEFQRELGVGGMGIVHLAQHRLSKELVAVKSLHALYTRDPEMKKRFEREAEILFQLNHPNIVKVRDLLEDENGLHLVMEYVPGRTLSKMIGHEVGPIVFERALPLIRQILDGMAYAHQHQVIHRDLKPGNIIVTPENVIKVTDFGIARIAGNVTLTGLGTKMGTLWYMPPESLDGHITDERGDVYSLGITIYEMLAGRNPFYNNPPYTELQLVRKIADQPVPDPRAFYPDIPERIVAVLGKAITKDPHARIASVHEFEQELYRAADIEHDADKAYAAPAAEEAPRAPAFSAGESLPRTNEIIERIQQNMILVEDGWFDMGNNVFFKSRVDNPLHRVYVDKFYINKYQVTQKEWEAVMGNNPSEFKGENNPVECVSWNDVQEFIKKLNSMTGRKYRLPTEAEWEYAARGGNISIGYEYSGSDDIDEVAWYINNSGRTTHPVGQKQPNELGIYGMTGNVWEWCSDWYGKEYYRNSPERNPQGPGSGSDRVRRGGSWDDDVVICHVAVREGSDPDDLGCDVGIRLVQDR